MPGKGYFFRALESPKIWKYLLNILETPRISTKFRVSSKDPIIFLMDDQHSFLSQVYSVTLNDSRLFEFRFLVIIYSL